jgi:hypothetical protein
MYESGFQTEVSAAIIQHEEEEVKVSISDSENIIFVEIGRKDAAYTADEARELAQNIEHNARQRWDEIPSDLIEYINELADVLDGKKDSTEVER